MDGQDIIVCRCQEVTEEEIVQAVRDGASTVDGVKRRTKACMGLCQGKTCGRLVERIVARESGRNPADVVPQTSRMPVRPIKIGFFGGSDDGGAI